MERASTGEHRALAVDAWHQPATPAELAVLEGLRAPVLDVGCGPGRIAAALAARGVPALGIDVSPSALATASAAGATVLGRSVFDPLPGEGRWSTALLLDGNIGIGGDPVRLLRRLHDLLAPWGEAVVEVEAPGSPTVVDSVRLRCSRLGDGPWFGWAWVGADDVAGHRGRRRALLLHGRTRRWAPPRPTRRRRGPSVLTPGPAAVTPSSVTVAVIAKAPVPGRVKTRLCPPATHAEAAAVAAASLQDTLDVVLACRAGRRVVVLDGEVGPWCPAGLDVVAQCGGGLGERLAHAVASLGGPVVVVGMDTPQLTAALVDRAVLQLCRPGTDAVLGDAEDGGYWGIGLRSADDRVFRGVPMSSPDTGRAQAAALERCGLRVAHLPRLRDVDTFEDARRVAAAVPGSRFAAAVGLVDARLAGTPSSAKMGR